MNFSHSGKEVTGGICAAKGYVANAVSAGIKDPQNLRLDLGLVFSEHPTTSAGVFTTNEIKAAPVKVSQAHLAETEQRAFVVNSGNANVCTGEEGIVHARDTAQQIGKHLGINAKEVGVCSTGVIGLPLPYLRMSEQFGALTASLSGEKGDLFRDSILTSDTRAKEIALELEIDGQKVRIGGCAKGAGMICPRMATMLCFITTDAALPKSLLQQLLSGANEQTFNKISVDGDMSTNDTILVMANGASGVTLSETHSKIEEFKDAFRYVLDHLARAIVLDGEKVTKFVTLVVKGARTEEEAHKVALAVGNSALVKSSWNGDDPNWGRVIHAVGYAGVSLQEEKVSLYWDGLAACENGKLGPAGINELRDVASKAAFTLTIDLGLGQASSYLYTSDLSPEYVDYNRSEYAYWNSFAKSTEVG